MFTKQARIVMRKPPKRNIIIKSAERVKSCIERQREGEEERERERERERQRERGRELPTKVRKTMLLTCSPSE